MGGSSELGAFPSGKCGAKPASPPELEIEPLPPTWEAQSLTTGLPEKSFHFHIFYTYNRSVTICRMVRFVVCLFCFLLSKNICQDDHKEKLEAEGRHQFEGIGDSLGAR